jgi:hypothetical protein
MFISKSELEKIRSQIAFLQELASKFQSDLIALQVKKGVIEAPGKSSKKIKQPRSPEFKAASSARMKAYWADKKAKASGA